MRHNRLVDSRSTLPARTAPPLVVALFLAGAVVFGGAALIALVSAIGLPGVVMVAGAAGSFAFVVLAVSRRRPIS